jgi:hypothetical protein
LTFVILFVVLIPTVVLAQSSLQEFSSETDTVVIEEVTSKNSVLIRSTLTRTKKPKATTQFWEELAVCETNSNWQDGGKYAGGLGIYQGTWENWGGDEFASTPPKATKAEQIIIANRVSTQGYKTIRHRDPKWAKIHGVPNSYVWEKEAVGFGGWGCYKSKSTGKYRMAKPRLYYHDTPHLVPLAEFRFNERGAIVKDLQTFLRITVDGHYGTKTRLAHVRWLKLKGHSTEGVPTLPSNKVVAFQQN